MDEVQQQKALAKQAREAEIERNDVVRRLMADPAGRRYVAYWLQRCSVWATPWTPDISATSFNCGQQNIGMELQSHIVTACPEHFLTMLKEQANGGPSTPETSSDADSDC